MKPQPASTRPRGALTCPASSSAGPIVAIVIAIVTVLGGLVAMQRPADRAVPARSSRRRSSSPRNYTGADALTIEQSVATPLEQQMNGVDNMLYMQSTNANDGTMTLTVTFDVDTDAEHRPGQRPEPHGAGAAEPAARRQPVRPDDAQADRPADADRVALLAEADLRRAVPRQLREHQHQRRALPRAGRRRGRASSAPATTRCASGSSRTCSPGSGSPCPIVARAIQQQSTVNPAGQVGAEPGADRPGDDLHRPRAGPAADAGGVRRHRRALESRRLGRPPAGRRAHRARRAQLPADRPRQRPARLRDRASSRRPARTRSPSPTGVKQTMDELADALPGGPRVRATRSTPRCRSPRASARS